MSSGDLPGPPPANRAFRRTARHFARIVNILRLTYFGGTISGRSTLDIRVDRVHIVRRRNGPRETFPALAGHGKRRLTFVP